MEELARVLDRTSWPARDESLQATLMALMLAFVLGQAVAWLYTHTHGSLSYSRGFTQSLVLMALVVTMVMIVIGNSIVTAFGLLGALAIIRFRNVLKDTRDTVFVFFVLVMGMAVGSGRQFTAVVATLAFVAAVAYLRFTDFGTSGRYDGHLSLRLSLASQPRAGELLRRHCSATRAVSVRHGASDDATELLYQVRLRDRARGRDLLADLERLDGATDMALVLRDELAEL